MKERRDLMIMMVTALAILTTIGKTEAVLSPPPPSTDSLTCLSDFDYCGPAFNTTHQPDYTCCIMLDDAYYYDYSCLCTVISGNMVAFDVKDYLVQCGYITASTTLCGSGQPIYYEASRIRSKARLAVGILIAIPIIIVVVIAVIVTVICILCRRRRNVGVHMIPGNVEFQGGPQFPSQFPKEQFPASSTSRTINEDSRETSR